MSTAPPLPRARPRAPQQRAPGLGGDPDARAAMAPCRLDAAERGDCASGSESAEGGRYDIKVDGHAARLVLTERGVNLRYQESRACCSRAPPDEKGPRSGGRGGQPRRSWRCPQTRLASFCILGLPSIAPIYPLPPGRARSTRGCGAFGAAAGAAAPAAHGGGGHSPGSLHIQAGRGAALCVVPSPPGPGLPRLRGGPRTGGGDHER